MNSFIKFGSKKLQYHLTFSNRRSLGISVKPEKEILVKAPFNSSLEKIKEKLQKKAPWIIKQQSYFLSFQPKTPKRKFISGETHLYLGRKYRLRIKLNKIEAVKINGKFIEIFTTNKANAKLLLHNWYLQNAKIKFQSLSFPLIQKFKKYNVGPSSIIIREMSLRWGSCTTKDKIILNPELIKAPKRCIEYVIIHELCHLVHHNHTQKFLDLQSKEMPDWDKWKSKLERLLA